MVARFSLCDSGRSRLAKVVLCLTLTFASLALERVGKPQGTPLAERKIEFPLGGAIRGSELLLKSPATILVGEIHGTWETPILVAALARTAQVEGVPTILCLEISSAEQSRLNQFLQSDGGKPAVDTLLAGAHWTSTDGRASTGMFALLELIRRLNRNGSDIRVVAMDINLDLSSKTLESLTPKEIEQLQALVNHRDRAMADVVLQARRQFARSNIVVLSGNVHAGVSTGLPGDADFTPMGWYIAQAVPETKSVDVQFSGGKAWVTTDKGTGPTRMNGVDRGVDPFIELTEKPVDGFHGRFYVGKISAAPPAK